MPTLKLRGLPMSMSFGCTTEDTSEVIFITFSGGSRNDDGAGSSLGTGNEFAGVFACTGWPTGGTANLAQKVSKSDAVIAGTGVAMPGSDDGSPESNPGTGTDAALGGRDTESLEYGELDVSCVGSVRTFDTEKSLCRTRLRSIIMGSVFDRLEHCLSLIHI